MKSLWRSFAGGEITPELFGRLDLTKYQTGLARCRNFRTLPHGPAERRPGLRFIVEAKSAEPPMGVGAPDNSAVRLIPFSFSADQTAVLEFGHNYIRFVINGSALLEDPVAVASVSGSTVNTTGAHGFVTGDDVFVGGRFVRVVVVDADTFNVVDRWGASVTVDPSAATAARVYTVVTPYAAADLADLHYAQDSDVLTLTHPGYEARELRRTAAVNWSLSVVSFAPTLSPPTGVNVVPTVGTAGNQNPQSYCVTCVASDNVTESLASSVVSTSNNLTVSGNYNTVVCASVPGYRYNFFKKRGGTFGYIGQVYASGATVSIIDDNVTPDTTKTPPEDIYTLNTADGKYPSAVTHFEQRRVFAATAEAPQTIWATRSGTASNLTSSVPSQDDDGMQFRIASQQQNAIRHLLPLSDLIVLTVGGEFRVYADGGGALTPTGFSVKPQGYSGASNAQPALTSGSILYVQAQGSRVREMAYNWQSNSYASIDISVMAPHLFDGYTTTALVYSRAPVQTLYAIRSDGALLGLTYVPEQQVYGWHRHDTDGAFESACVVSEGAEDVLYVVVRRQVNARTVRYIERLGSTSWVDQADAFYVDSGLTYRGDGGVMVTVLSGLHHLEGKEVQILTDGATHPPRTVVNGAITLDYEALVVHAGLGYTSDLVTLPLAAQELPASGQGVMKNVNGVRLRVARSSSVKAGPTLDRLTEYPSRDVADPFDSPPALRSAEMRFSIGPSWNSDGQVCVQQTEPLPLTVLSVALDVAPGG